MRWDVAKWFKKPLILLAGDEHMLRHRALRALLELGAAGDDFDLETFFADTSSPAEWLASAGTSPFLSPRRVAVVRNLLRSEAQKSFKIGPLPDTALLILVADDESGDQDRQRKFDSARKEWIKAVQAEGGEVPDFTVSPAEVNAGLKEAAEKFDKKINDKALETLKEMTGGSLSRGLEELEKLVLYVGSEPQIREADVCLVTLPSPDWSVYKMIDAITRGDGGEALKQLKVMIGSTRKVEDVAFSLIFPTLSSQMKLLWQARICVEAKVDPAHAPSSITSLFPDKPNITKDVEWKQKRSLQTARALDFDALTSMLQIICDADSRLKGILPALDSSETLERMVLEMAQVGRRGVATQRPMAGARR